MLVAQATRARRDHLRRTPATTHDVSTTALGARDATRLRWATQPRISATRAIHRLRLNGGAVVGRVRIPEFAGKLIGA